MITRFAAAYLSLLLCATTLMSPVQAQEKKTDSLGVKLPTDPQQWLNYPPISLDRLDGKGIVLYFFEEQCPKCAEKWPDHLEVSDRNQLSPVVFIAVNSGNTPGQVAQYVAKHNITWPVIVDTDRTFERQLLANPISLQNVTALYIRTPDGKWQTRDSSRLSQAATAASKEGRWLVNPNSIPLELRPAWGLVELGNFAGALPLITRAERRGSDQVKQAATLLRDAVATSLDKEQLAIRDLMTAGDDWQAYKALSSLTQAYDGYEIDEELVAKLKELADSEKVKNEQAAAKKLAAAYRVGAPNTAGAVKRATKMLERIVDDYPGTEAADEASDLLLKLSSVNPGS